MAIRYACAKLRPAITHLPGNFLEKSHFIEVVMKLDRTSSPGLPLCHDYPTIGAYLYRDENINLLNLQKLWMDVCNYIDGVDEAYPLRVFVKGEPLKNAKFNEGRFRLITAVSLVNMVVDQMLFSTQNDKEVTLFDQIPVMPGWSTTYGGWKCIDSQAVGLDRKAWDYSVPAWLLAADLSLREQLCVNASNQWKQLATRRYDDLYSSARLQLSDGAIFTQQFGGVVKSGAVNTIASNSHMQLILHAYTALMVGSPLGTYFVAMGDDTLQSSDSLTTEYVEYLSKIVNLKEPAIGEFCSMQFYPGGRVEPLNLGRHLNNLACVKDHLLPDTLRSLQVVYALSNYLPRIRQITLALAPEAYLFPAELEVIMGE